MSVLCVSHHQGDPLWSARLLHTAPQAIKDAHYRLAHGECQSLDVVKL